MIGNSSPSRLDEIRNTEDLDGKDRRPGSADPIEQSRSIRNDLLPLGNDAPSLGADLADALLRQGALQLLAQQGEP